MPWGTTSHGLNLFVGNRQTVKKKTSMASWLWLWDAVSMSALAIILFPAIQLVLTLDAAWAACLLGHAVTHAITAMVKVATHESIDAAWVRRPQGASNCNIACSNGDRSGAPGFPSGHMSTAAFFWTFAALLTRHRGAGALHLAAVVCAGAAYTMLTALARHHKRCHTLLQIVVGTLLGCAVGAVTFGLYAAAARAWAL